MIFVIAQHKDNKLKSITSELLIFAQRAGRDFGQPVTAIVLGASTAALVEELKGRKIDRILAVEDPQLADYSPDTYVGVLKSLSEEEKPFLVLMGHTTQEMDFAPRLSVALRRPLIAGCVEYEKQGDGVLLTRQIFNAKMSMKTVARGKPPTLSLLYRAHFQATKSRVAKMRKWSFCRFRLPRPVAGRSSSVSRPQEERRICRQRRSSCPAVAD